MIDLPTISINKTVQFTSINPYDTQLYSGKIISICNSNIARNYGDIVKYNNQVQGIAPTTGDISTLDFFIIQNSKQNSPAPFATQWILAGSLKIITVPAVGTIEIYNTTSELLSSAVRLLTANGFSAKLIVSATTEN